MQAGAALIDDGSISADKIDFATINAGVVSGAAITLRTLPADRLVLDSITAQEIAPNAVGASELADNSVDTAALQAGAVTGGVGGKIATDTITADNLAPASVGTSELTNAAVTTAKVGQNQITGGATGSLALNTITTDNVAEINGSKLSDDSVTARQIAANAITASELADNSVDLAAIGVGQVSGSAGTKATIEAASIGTADLSDGLITDVKLAAGAVTTAALLDGAVTNAKITGDISLDKLPPTTAGGEVAAGPAGGPGDITYRALVGTDLPVAAIGVRGAVEPGAGLQMSGNAIGLDRTITPSTGRSLVEFDQYGRVTTGSAIALSDLPTLTGAVLPPATAGTLGGVSVAGPELEVNAAGVLSHSTKAGLSTGIYTKVTVNQYGHITAAEQLNAADIPGIDASKIITGYLDPGVFAAGSITRDMLADYATAFIQEATPPVTGVRAGTLWLQESTGQLRMFNGNSFFAIGFGRLSAENLRYCGTFNAATGAIAGLTPFGVTEGFKIGDLVPAASDRFSGVYFVAATAGGGTTALPGATFDAGDWILCNGAVAGWVRIDTLSGSGGGSGATHLNDLLDVTIDPSVTADSLLQYTASGQWINVAELVGGTY